MNCIQPERARGRDVEVAAVVGLDLVDRREDLPAHAVLDAGGLVEREQERRDPELVDEEVRHADRGGAGHRQREGRVGRASARRRARGRAAAALFFATRSFATRSSLERSFLPLRLPARSFRLPAAARRGGGRLAGRLVRRTVAGARRVGLAAARRRDRVRGGRAGDGRSPRGRWAAGACGAVRRRRGDHAVVDDLRDGRRDAGDRVGRDGGAGRHVDGARDALARDEDDRARSAARPGAGARRRRGRPWPRSPR